EPNGDGREPALERGRHRALLCRDEDTGRAERLNRVPHDLVRTAGFLQVKMAHRPARQQPHQLRHPRHLVASQVAEPGIAHRGHAAAPARPGPVKGHQRPVQGPPDIELHVLGARLQRAPVRLVRPAPRGLAAAPVRRYRGGGAVSLAHAGIIRRPQPRSPGQGPPPPSCIPAVHGIAAMLAVEVAALAVMTTGIILLAHRAPILARQRAETAEAAAVTASSWITWRPTPTAQAGVTRHDDGREAGLTGDQRKRLTLRLVA